MQMLILLLREINSEKTVDLIKYSSFFLSLIIGITICACSIRYKGFRIGVITILILLLFLAWLSFNSISSLIIDFLFYANYGQ